MTRSGWPASSPITPEASLEVEERGLVDELADIRGREADGLVVGSSTSWLLLAVGVPLLAEGRNPAG
jgi:hypothetical protein